MAVPCLPPFRRSLARLDAGEGKRRGGCGLFCNRSDARVRVPPEMQLSILLSCCLGGFKLPIYVAN